MSTVSISDRFKAVQQLMPLFIGRDDNMKDASKHAKMAESNIYKGTKLQEEYVKRVEEYSQMMQQKQYSVQSPSQGDDTSCFDHAHPNIKDFGNYKGYEHTCGRTSIVYKCCRTVSTIGRSDEAIFALKITNPSTWVQPHDGYREMRILKRLNGRSHVLLPIEILKKQPNLMLVFPFYQYTLCDIIEQGSPGERNTIRKIFKQITQALAFCHSEGIIHRDIKPSNILVESLNGPAYLCDFGIAWASNDHDTKELQDSKATDIGTTCYRAPETLFGYQAYGPEVDLWALGCCIAEAESGSALFDAGDLGSDLALIASIFKTLGTPTVESWPEAANFPDFGKMTFFDFKCKPWDEILSGVDDKVRSIVANLVVYSQSRRLAASQALEHPYLNEKEL